jgi:hypothetical protein
MLCTAELKSLIQFDRQGIGYRDLKSENVLIGLAAT